MKTRIFLMFISLCFLVQKIYASDEWRIFGPGPSEKSMYSDPPFLKWHNDSIKYWIESSPSGLSYLIDDSFDTWEDVGLYDFTKTSSDYEITIETMGGEHTWFGYGPPTYNESTGEITGALIQLNVGTCQGHSLVWTDGTENVGGGGTWYVDVQNCVTHEIGHNLGIAHHSTGNGCPTMATRDQCPSFNTTLNRRSLETDDTEALEFLVKNLHVPSEYSSINSAINVYFLNQTVKVASGTYSETISMKSGVDLIGENMVNTIIDGTIAFSNDDYAGIEELTVKDKITIYNSDNVTLDHIKSGHSDCYIESVSSELALNDLYFDQSQSKAFYGHDCGYSDFYSGSLRYKNNQALYIHFFDTADLTNPYFCNNNFDIYVTPFSYVWVYGENKLFQQSNRR